MQSSVDLRSKLVSPQAEKLRFILVGCINTATDFIVLNLLLIFAGQVIYVANIASTFCAMLVSLFLNKGFVFNQGYQVTKKEIALFVAVTLTGLWGIQSLVIFILTQQFPEPLDTIAHTIQNYGPVQSLSFSFLRDNGAKIVATIASLIWNYTLYKHVVFRRQKAEQTHDQA